MKREGFNEVVVLFFAQVILCTVIAINYRSISQAHYIYTSLSSMSIAGITYFLIQRISDNHKKRKKSKQRDFTWIGFMIGSVVGDIVGIYISKLLLGA